ncbi:MAG TPA: hypothetical protein DCE41_16245 [Cytophagales bacterium]|nr:hypothetical protein [Cytophagales bacterium]HAA23610.1 hypothetical protein [Cytophagales bacterium]HAP60752.1 hypothetical protein [Cytophagales bacterium]
MDTILKKYFDKTFQIEGIRNLDQFKSDFDVLKKDSPNYRFIKHLVLISLDVFKVEDNVYALQNKIMIDLMQKELKQTLAGDLKSYSKTEPDTEKIISIIIGLLELFKPFGLLDFQAIGYLLRNGGSVDLNRLDYNRKEEIEDLRKEEIEDLRKKEIEDLDNCLKELKKEDNSSSEAYNRTLNESLDHILRKFRLQKIVTCVHLLSTSMGLDHLYSYAFFKDSPTRIALYSRGALFYQKDVFKDEEHQQMNRDKSNISTRSINTSSIAELIQFVGDYRNLSNEKKVQLSGLYYWPGIEAEFPERTTLMISYDQLYPTLYVRNTITGETLNELFIQENPYSINITYNEEVFTPDEQGQNNPKLKQFATSPAGGKIQDGNHMVNFAQIPRTIPKGLKIENEVGLYDYSDLSLFLKQSDNYELVIQIPYTPPFADMLLNLNFSSSNKGEALILSST